MKQQEFITKKWDLYINGWFHHNEIVFLHDGQIESNGTEGFSYWKINNDLLDLYDAQNKLCYSLRYIPSAHILINEANHRIKNNDLFLAQNLSHLELQEIFHDDQLSQKIANKSALYKSEKGDVWGRIFFGIDGVIYHYHNPNESYWKVENGYLKIYNKDGDISCIQENINYNTLDLPQSIKQITLKHSSSNNFHYLDFLQLQNPDTTMVEPVKFLNVDACFSNRSDTLLVIFNSAAGEYDGKLTFYEFYHTPYQFAVDYIRISQSAPTRVYLDDFEKIEKLINLNSYKKVVFLGMSIGGYASIWFAENLARKNIDTKYISITIQPISSLSKEFSEIMRMKYQDGYRAKTLTDEIIKSYESSGFTLDLSELLRDPLENATHYVAYDALNDAEKEHMSNLLSNRTLQTAFAYGNNHAEGCGHIYNSGYLENVLRKLLITKR